MFIDGLGISNFRSFGKDIQYLGPFGKINLLVGQNNSGKSNVLSFLTRHYSTVLQTCRSGSFKMSFDGIDRHLGQQEDGFQIAFGLRPGSEMYQDTLERCQTQLAGHRNNEMLLEAIKKLLESAPLSPAGDIAWFRYSKHNHAPNSLLDKALIDELYNSRVLDNAVWSAIWSALTSQNGGDLGTHWIVETIRALSPVRHEPPAIAFVPAIRRIGEKGQQTDDYSGLDLIEKLAQLQDPPYNAEERRQQFDKINDLLRDVTGSRSAQIRIPYDRDMITVRMDDKPLPLSSLGTGIHEVIILAAAATVLHEQVLCIEEPELHLHPLLQKKLLRYLDAKTDNQYIFTTHSAHLLDHPGSSIHHVRYHDKASYVERADSPIARAKICSELGYRASDLVQANAVIWVEGPSDAIYLRWWLKAASPELIEGLHYSLMFYGGRLLSHLSANDPEITDFISLRRLNRHIAIVIDSDRTTTRTALNATKKRIASEFDQGPVSRG